MRIYGLIGYPLSHSFSSKYFADKFLREGIEGYRYDHFPIPEIGMLPGLLKQHPGLCGLNVTIPYKKEVLAFLDDSSNLPQGMSACNCIRIDNGRLTGFNTDVAGFRQSISPLLKPNHQQALILGNGGATEAVRYVLSATGIKFLVVGRKKAQGVDLLYADLDAAVMKSHNVIVNTTPLGTFPEITGCPPIPYEFVGDQHLLYDLVYNPTVTRFMQLGSERGAVVKNGYDMLVIQAEESWKIWQAANSQP
jgi:shikimate dehydrogenase